MSSWKEQTRCGEIRTVFHKQQKFTSLLAIASHPCGRREHGDFVSTLLGKMRVHAEEEECSVEEPHGY
jgi:hypothetical protein